MLHTLFIKISGEYIATVNLVCHTAVVCVVTQRGGGALRDDTKNDWVVDYC